MPNARRCTRCKVRYAQSGGRCRRCQNEIAGLSNHVYQRPFGARVHQTRTDDGAKSWWTEATREGFTKTAEGRTFAGHGIRHEGKSGWGRG